MTAPAPGPAIARTQDRDPVVDAVLADALRHWAQRRTLADPNAWEHTRREVVAAVAAGVYPGAADQHARALTVLAVLADAEPGQPTGPRVVSAAHVDQLPEGAVVLDFWGEAWQRVTPSLWVCTSGRAEQSLAWEHDDPRECQFRVLWDGQDPQD